MTQLDNVIEMEKFVLSAMQIRAGECVPAVAAALSPDDFYRPQHRLVFSAILKLYAEGTPPNVLSLKDELNRIGELDAVGIEFLWFLMEYANTTAYVPAYCEKIKEAANLRRLQLTAEKIAQDAACGKKTAAELLDSFNAEAAAFANPVEQFNLSSINDCIPDFFLQELKKMSALTSLKSGFDNIDKSQILLPGLVLVGAEPAIGKTDFVWQMLEQMARGGCKCVYASYEMSKMAMLRRLIARHIFNQDPFTPLTASNLHENVKYGEYAADIANAMDNVFNANLDLHILELYGQNVDSLIRLLRPLCSETDKIPVIAVDYLQNLAAATNPDNPKIAVDECLGKLKKLQDDTGALFVIVSSFNRANYRLPVTFASFKESGAAEYFADVMWGLQLNAINDIVSKDKAIEIDEKISNAFKMQPRQIQLRCIKNRNGNTYDAYFRYFSANSYFAPCEITDFADDEIPAHIADSTSGTASVGSYNED